MNKLSRLSSMMMAAAIASIASSSAAAFGGIKAGATKSLKPIKTEAPSASKGGRGYGRNKHGNTAAFVRAARKARNIRRHRAACR